MKKKKMLTLVLSAAMALTTFAPVATNAAPVCAHPDRVWVDQVDATCLKTGIRGHFECQNPECGLLIDGDDNVFDNYSDFYYTLEEGGHKNRVTYDTKEPTCVSDGYYGHVYCVDCGAYLAADDENAMEYNYETDVRIPAVDHSYVGISKNEPTHTENGNVAYGQCTGCNLIVDYDDPTKVLAPEDIVIPATGHVNAQHFEAKTANCTERGNIDVYLCMECDKWFDSADADAKELAYADVFSPATGHQNKKFVEKLAPTCVDSGYWGHYLCEDCGAYLNEKDEVLDWEKDLYRKATGIHSVERIRGFAANCTDDGMKNCWHCTVCDKYFAKKDAKKEINPIIPATGHHKGQHVRAKAPTCVRAGRIEHYRCADCSAYLDKNGNVLAREEVIIPADAKYHRYNDGVCTICGDDLREITVIFKDKRGTRKVYTVSKGGYCKVPGTRDVYNNPSKNTWKCSDAKLTVKKNAYVDFEDLLFADFDENGKATVTFVGNYKYK